MTPAYVQATEWLRAHPEYHNVGAKTLSRTIEHPKFTRFIWRQAKKALALPPAPYPTAHSYPETRKPRVLASHDTRIEINVLTGIATVTVDGQASTAKVRHMDHIVGFYKHHGYKYAWLNNTTVLLTKSKRKASKAA